LNAASPSPHKGPGIGDGLPRSLRPARCGRRRFIVVAVRERA
jgi:hypothetical protein